LRKKIAALSVAALVGLTTMTSTAFAQTEQELKSSEQQVQKERADVTNNLSKAEKEIADVLYELDHQNAKINKTKQALQANENKLTETKKSIADSEKKVENLKRDIADLEDKIVKRFDILKERLSSYQKSGGDIAFLDVLAGSQSFSEFASRAKAVESISQSDLNLMKNLEADQNELKEKKKAVDERLAQQKDERSELEGVKKTIADQKKQLEADKEELENKRTELNDKKNSLKMKDSELATLQEQIGTELKLKKEESERIAREAAERKAKAEVEKARQEEATRLEAEKEKANQTSVSREQNTNVTSKESTSAPVKQHNTSSNSKPAKEAEKTTSAPAQTGGLSAAISAGYGQIGTPYVWGGKQPGGFDCSGFVSWAYRQAGISVPSSTAGLQSVGTKISYSSAKPGDMVFFNTYKTNGHVGIYLGGGKFIGAQDDGLDVANMNSGYWKSHFSGHVRRIQ